MNIFVRFSIILLLFSALKGGDDLSLFNIIQSNLSKYRQSVRISDYSFQNGIIQITLDGRRTNIKSQMLLGFYSIGLALNRVNIHCREIEILIHDKMKRSGLVYARASVEEVMNLSQGRLSSEHFFILIGY